MFFKAELFVIQYGINHTIQLCDIAHIIIITNAILAAKQIFDTSIQFHSETILVTSSSLYIYWLTKILKVNPIFPSKSSWEFSRKEESNSIVHKW